MNGTRYFTAGLNVVSAILTAAGFYTFLQPWAETLVGTYAWVAAALVSGLASLVVQGVLHSFWWRTGSEGFLRSPFSLLVGVAMSGISWFGGAGGALLIANHATLLAEQQRAEGSATTLPLRAFANGYADLAAEVSGLARRATELSNIEKNVGGTCRNEPSQGGICGIRCRLRQRHAEALNETAALADGLARQSREISIGMSTASDLAAQRSSYAAAVRLQGNPDQRRISERLRSVARQLSEPVVDPDTNRSFTCEDPGFAASLAELASRATAPVELPDVAPREQSVDMSDALGCVAARVGAIVGVSRPCAGIGDGPLLWALGLEVVIVLLLLAETKRLRRFGALPTEPQNFQLAGTRLKSGAELEECRWLMRAFSLHVVHAGRRGRFIAVPVDGPIEAYADGTRLARYFGEMAPELSEVPLGELMPGWVIGRKAAFGEAATFDLYRWPAVADLRVRQAERDLARSAKPNADVAAPAA